VQVGQAERARIDHATSTPEEVDAAVCTSPDRPLPPGSDSMNEFDLCRLYPSPVSTRP
jgi:hypothetical protein